MKSRPKTISKTTNKGSGYCTNPKCPDFNKKIFQLNPPQKYYICSSCMSKGLLVKEKVIYTTDPGPWKEVRIEFDYCPVENKYKSLLVLIDNLIRKGRVYTLFTPLITTQRRATTIAESLFSVLLYGDEPVYPPVRELIIDICAEDSVFKQQLHNLQIMLEKRGLKS